MTTPEVPRQVVEQIVRSYLGRATRRYVPFMVGLVTLAFVVALVPSVSPNTTTSLAGGGVGGPAGTNGNAAAGTVAGPGALGSAGNGLTGSSGPGGALGPGTTGGSVAAGTAGGTVTTSGVPVSAGGAASQLHADCSHRQFSWSKNAPCRVTFTGSNGGAVSRGVSAKEIVASFRISNSGQSAAVEAAAAGRSLNQESYFHDIQMYVNFFNTQYQLYGRKVVLKKFTGQGDWLSEYQGQNLEGAQADAATARSLGAFADLTTAATATTPAYAEDLGRQGIVDAGGVVASQRWFEQHSPYAISALPALDALANFWGATACQRMVGLNAVFAGDAVTQQTPRAFGIVAPEVPDYMHVADDLQHKITACGGKVAKRINYTLNISTLAQQDASIAAQMKAAGVTTIILLCDTISPTLLSNSAKSQNYYPEWMSTNNGDDYGQQRDSTEWAHALLTGGTSPSEKSTEFYRVYKLADPHGEPQLSDVWLPSAYYSALLFFNGLQTAGPTLKPVTLTRGVFSLPPSLAGAEFPWEPGRDIFTPASAVKIGWWDPSKTSPGNGNAGTSVDCTGVDAGSRPIQRYEPSAYGPKRTQLHCFGK